MQQVRRSAWLSRFREYQPSDQDDTLNRSEASKQSIRPDNSDHESRKILERVLIVEDEVHARTGLTELIGSWGYRTEGAADGVEGLEKAIAWSPSIIVTDLKMP